MFMTLTTEVLNNLKGAKKVQIWLRIIFVHSVNYCNAICKLNWNFKLTTDLNYLGHPTGINQMDFLE